MLDSTLGSEFAASPAEAYRKGAREKKLVFVLHVSGQFEKHANAASYAIVLLTGDDEGGVKGHPQSPRARQNVVFELGFFFGALKGENVAVLYDAAAAQALESAIMDSKAPRVREIIRLAARSRAAPGLTHG